ncbi:MAG: hypothetical protein ACKVK6_08970, partial [bacterium]
QLTIMGVPVFTDDSTVFEIDDPMGTTQPVLKTCFFENLNEGDFVEARQDKGDPKEPSLTFESDAATDVTLVKKKNEPTCSPGR